MKSKENTHQNPGQEELSVQEENSSTVTITENKIDQQPHTDPGQTEEKTTQETQAIQDIAEILPQQEELKQETVTDAAPAREDEPAEPASADPDSGNSLVPEVQVETPSQEILESVPDIILEHEVHEHEEELHEEILEHEDLAGEFNYDTLTREELIGMLQNAVSESDINAVKTRIAQIKVAFLKKRKEDNLQKYEQAMEEGSSKEDLSSEPDDLDIKFEEIFNIYKANKARFSEEQEKIKLENLKKKQHILDELKHLINSEETLKKTYDEFKTLQEKWKEIGMVPRQEITNLWQNYHFLVEKFFEKVKINKDLKDLDMKKNLEAKIALCEKTEELLLETSVLRSFKKLQKYHEEWKELGPVPADKKDEIWERFKNATDKINERRREHYAKIEEEQQKNLETKIALAEQAEEVIGLNNENIKDWQANTTKVNELLKIWKTIGPVPQKQNNEIWVRFKSSLDNFFANKKEFFDKLKEQQIQNYNLKFELCLQAESMKSNTEWKKTTNDLIRLQNDWKKIGPVPKKNSDKIWKRFRAACDEFFNAKTNYFSNIQANEEENLNRKMDLIKRLKEQEFTVDKSENLNLLKNFQREWTEIGHIPIKMKDKLQNEFRTIINERLDQLKISEVEISTMNYQSRVESIKNDPQAKRLISRERENLVSRINQLKEEVSTWENNIGFLANSKNASILKDEFEKKINKTKSEVKVLEAKLKMLRMQ
jgi:hypothetical protein